MSPDEADPSVHGEHHKKETFLGAAFSGFPSPAPSWYSSPLRERCLRDLALSRFACAHRATNMAFVSFWMESAGSVGTMCNLLQH